MCCVCIQSSPLSRLSRASGLQNRDCSLLSGQTEDDSVFSVAAQKPWNSRLTVHSCPLGLFFHSVASYLCYFVKRTLVSCFLPSLVFFSTKKYFVVYDLKTKNCVFCDPGISFFILTEGDFTKSFPWGFVLDFDIFWDLNFLYLFSQISLVGFFFLSCFFLQRRILICVFVTLGWAFLFLQRELGSTAK